MRSFLSTMATGPRLATLTLLLSASPLVRSTPARLSPANLHLLEEREAVDSRFATLLPRADCANPCGYGGWLCCAQAGQCYTDNSNQAQCGAATAAISSPATGYWQYYTSTWIETDTETKTAVYSTWVASVSASPTSGSCSIPCGSSCCSTGEYCLIWSSGTCAKQGTTPGAGATAGNTASLSAPLRPTSSGLVVITATVRPTTTVPFESAVPTGQNVTITDGNGGLSGGAIAGIVIGVLAGIFLLILICLFCCARAIFDSALAIFGLGKKRRHTHEETYIEEHHHSSGAAGGRWYGNNRPSRPPRPEGEKSGLGGLAGVGAALGGLALLLGLKRKHDRKHEEKSDYGSTYYSSDYTSSSSASSSDRHTRHTRDSRYTRDTRHSSRR